MASIITNNTDVATNNQDGIAGYMADHTYGFTVDMRMGMDAIVGSKIGAINLN